MFAYMLSPENIEHKALDELLAKGWFRMRQTIFTTHFLHFSNRFFSAIWLRVDLQRLGTDRKFEELKKRNRQFTIAIQKANPDRLHEQLFAAYRNSIDFDTSDNIRQLLYGYDMDNRFNTFEINLYDKHTLIASGYFDKGNTSAAGITSFYHPSYKKFSLGKYLIYCKMEFCQQQGLQYFYPGYTVPGYGMFDYKLSIGQQAMEYYDLGRQQWLPYRADSFAVTPIQKMHTQLYDLQRQLQQRISRSKVYYYRYFDACLDPYFAGQPLLDFPVMLHFRYLSATLLHQIVVYNVCTSQFQLLECSTVYQMESYEGNHSVFNSHLLQVEEVVASVSEIKEIVGLLQ